MWTHSYATVTACFSAGCIYTTWSRQTHEGSNTASMGVYTPHQHTRNRRVSSLLRAVYIHRSYSLILNRYRQSFRRVYIHRFSAIGCVETYARGAGGKYPRRVYYRESPHHSPRFPNRPRPSRKQSKRQRMPPALFGRNKNAISPSCRAGTFSGCGAAEASGYGERCQHKSATTHFIRGVTHNDI